MVLGDPEPCQTQEFLSTKHDRTYGSSVVVVDVSRRNERGTIIYVPGQVTIRAICMQFIRTNLDCTYIISKLFLGNSYPKKSNPKAKMYGYEFFGDVVHNIKLRLFVLRITLTLTLYLESGRSSVENS